MDRVRVGFRSCPLLSPALIFIKIGTRVVSLWDKVPGANSAGRRPGADVPKRSQPRHAIQRSVDDCWWSTTKDQSIVW